MLVLPGYRTSADAAHLVTRRRVRIKTTLRAIFNVLVIGLPRCPGGVGFRLLIWLTGSPMRSDERDASASFIGRSLLALLWQMMLAREQMSALDRLLRSLPWRRAGTQQDVSINMSAAMLGASYAYFRVPTCTKCGVITKH